MQYHCEGNTVLGYPRVIESSGQREGASVPSSSLWGKLWRRYSPSLCPPQQGRDLACSPPQSLSWGGRLAMDEGGNKQGLFYCT